MNNLYSLIFSIFLVLNTNILALKVDRLFMEDSIYNITVLDNEGYQISLSDYEGKVLLIVNVASNCGYTTQYSGLQELYNRFKDLSFEILAFPCNDFGGQEPGSNEVIADFCSVNFGVTFKLFDKIQVLGDGKSPLYAMLINSPYVETGDVRWNFEKFLIARDGQVVERFRSSTEPLSEEIITSIESELKK